MSTLHRTLQRERPHPALAIRPSILVAMIYVWGLFLAWVAFNVTLANRGADALLSDPGVLSIARAIGWLILLYVGADGWKTHRQTGRIGALIVNGVAMLAVGGALWYLYLLEGLPVF